MESKERKKREAKGAARLQDMKSRVMRRSVHLIVFDGKGNREASRYTHVTHGPSMSHVESC
jgi:hypothetical protein